MSQSSLDENLEIIYPKDLDKINEEIIQIDEQIQKDLLNGQTIARPDQIKAVSDFIKKNNAALKKRNMYMVYGHKTRDELEKLIISRLIIDKMSRFTLITEFVEESDLL